MVLERSPLGQDLVRRTIFIAGSQQLRAGAPMQLSQLSGNVKANGRAQLSSRHCFALQPVHAAGRSRRRHSVAAVKRLDVQAVSGQAAVSLPHVCSPVGASHALTSTLLAAPARSSPH